MEFQEVKYTKTVEGNFDVQLIHNNTVAATIVFPSEELAKEYVEFKQKLKADTDKLLAQLKANLNAEATKVGATVNRAVVAVDKAVEAVRVTTTEAEESGVKKVEHQKPIDTSAKVGKDTTIDTSAKIGKDTIIDTSAKVVFPE